MWRRPARRRAYVSTASVGYIGQLKQRARAIKRETYTLYLACRDPRTPRYVKLFAGGIVAYAISPIDLIPDFIPVLGYLDDLILLPLAITLAVKLIPEPVLIECRAKAQLHSERPTSRTAAVVIIAIWLGTAGLIIGIVVRAMS
ncbi:MAG: DUF1232 domain-containing protein [Chloroflexi bacterium]|nr:DUF1232 domain-containing protein [Chloroflexota bacterium]